MKKRIRSLLSIFSAATIATLVSCGEAGVGFDVASELPVDIGTMQIFIQGTGGISEDIDAETLSFNYSLSDVDGFDDAIDELDEVGAEVFLLGLAIEITGINDVGETYDENLPVQNVGLEFNLSNGSTEVLTIPFPNNELDNLSKTDLDISAVKSIIESELKNNKTLNATFVFDAGTISTPFSDEIVDFDITVHFNVALRVRDILD